MTKYACGTESFSNIHLSFHCSPSPRSSDAPCIQITSKWAVCRAHVGSTSRSVHLFGDKISWNPATCIRVAWKNLFACKFLYLTQMTDLESLGWGQTLCISPKFQKLMLLALRCKDHRWPTFGMSQQSSLLHIIVIMQPSKIKHQFLQQLDEVFAKGQIYNISKDIQVLRDNYS